jgi:heptosyltransferase I
MKSFHSPSSGSKKRKALHSLERRFDSLKSRPSYDQIIDAQGLVKSALVTYFLKGNVHGFDRFSAREKFAAWFYDTASSIPYELNVIKRNVQVITEALKIPYDENDIFYKQPLFPSYPKPIWMEDSQKSIACVIGASWPSKCYPIEHFATLCSAPSLSVLFDLGK